MSKSSLAAISFVYFLTMATVFGDISIKTIFSFSGTNGTGPVGRLIEPTIQRASMARAEVAVEAPWLIVLLRATRHILREEEPLAAI